MQGSPGGVLPKTKLGVYQIGHRSSVNCTGTEAGNYGTGIYVHTGNEHTRSPEPGYSSFLLALAGKTKTPHSYMEKKERASIKPRNYTITRFAACRDGWLKPIAMLFPPTLLCWRQSCIHFEREASRVMVEASSHHSFRTRANKRKATTTFLI